MSNDSALLFLNGEPPSDKLVKTVDFSSAFTICADGAYNYLKKYMIPNLLLGDFDSMEDDVNLSGISCERYPIDKNDTDASLAVKRAAQLGFKKIDIYGAFGKRPDHELVNYSLLALADSLNMAAALIGEDFNVYYITAARPFIKNMKKGALVSLVPYSDKAHILYTKGLKYPAVDIDVDKINIFTTSNLSEGGECQYRLSFGAALLFMEK